MKHFNKFGKHLRNQDSELPSGFSWEDMEDGIFDKVDQKGGLPPKQGASNKWNRGIILLMALLIIGLTSLLIHTQRKVNRLADAVVSNQLESSLYQKQKIENKEVSNIQNTTLVNPQNENNSSSTHTAKDAEAPANETLAIVHENKLGQASNKAVSKENDSFKKKENLVRTKQTKLQTSKIEKASLSRTLNNKSSRTGVENNSTSSNSANLSETSKDSNESKGLVESNSLAFESREEVVIKQLETEAGLIVIANRDFEVGPFTIKENANDRKISKWSSLVAYGVHQWSFAPEQEADNIYNYSDALGGHSLSARLSYQINPRWVVSTGIDLDFLRYKLIAEFTSLQERMVEDAVVEIIVSPTGGRTEVRRDTFVMDTINRQIRHFNTMRAIQIPLMIQAKHSFGQWSTGLGIGPSLHGLMQYEGRYLENGEAQYFDSNDDLFTNRWTLALNSEAFIERSLTKRIASGVNISYTQQMGEWGNGSTSSLRSKLVRSQIYMRFSF